MFLLSTLPTGDKKQAGRSQESTDRVAVFLDNWPRLITPGSLVLAYVFMK
uniref:Uncharacterized protein n=1 Tax=Octopus bimaculoides TaxID=37653 RepID=A0A0L8HIE5_OCTBM